MSAHTGRPSNAAEQTHGRGWLIALLFLVAVISYVDRGSLSIAAPTLAVDIGLSPVDMGWLLSAFFWSYALLQIPGGWIVDRYPVGWVLAIGVGLWSLATLASGLVHDFALLVVMRLLLGAGEAVLFPCLSKVMAGAFPPDRRGLPNSIIDAGAKLGPALGVLGGGLLVAHYDWRILFVVLGFTSLAWLAPWGLWNRAYGLKAPPRVAAGSAPAGPGFADILRQRDFWGVTIGSAAYSYAFYFFLTWLPTYLVRERQLSLESMAVLGSIPFWGAAAAALAAGWASDYLIRRGMSRTVVRKAAVGFGLLLSMIALPSAMVPDVGQSVWLLSIAYVAFGIFGSNFWAISQTLAGEAAAGKWIGLQNALSALTGVAAPLVTGIIVERTGSFLPAFVVTAVLAVIGAASYVFVVGRIDPIDWSRRRPAELTKPAPV